MLIKLLFLLCLYYPLDAVLFVSSNNASIPVEKQSVKVEELSFDTFIRNETASIFLQFDLLGHQKAVTKEELTMTVNDKDQKFEILDSSSKVTTKNQIYVVQEQNNSNITLTIRFYKAINVIPGVYELTLKIGSESYVCSSYITVVPLAKKFQKPRLGLEGDPMRITCLYDAYPNLTEIVWMKLSSGFNDPTKPGNLTFNNATIITADNDDRIEITSGKESKKTNDTLFIRSLKSSDIGIYVCQLKSDGKEDFAAVKVNVKDRWAALYPFMGIVAEVVILVTAILAYEHYQIRTQNKNKTNYDVAADEDNKDTAIPLTSAAPGNGQSVISEAQGDNTAPGSPDGEVPTVDVKTGNNNAEQVRQRPTSQET